MFSMLHALFGLSVLFAAPSVATGSSSLLAGASAVEPARSVSTFASSPAQEGRSSSASSASSSSSSPSSSASTSPSNATPSSSGSSSQNSTSAAPEPASQAVPDAVASALDALRAGDADRALSVLCEALALDPDDARARAVRAGICGTMETACPRLAALDHDAALALAPDVEREEFLARGLLFQALGQDGEAQASLGLAAAREPADLETLVRCARARKATLYWGESLTSLWGEARALEPKTNAERWYRLEAALLGGAGELALADADALLAARADDERARFARGLALLALQRHAEAREALERAIAGVEASAFTLERLGVARERAGDVPGALRAFTLALKLAPKDEVVLWHRAQLHARRKAWTEALADAERLLALESPIADAWNALRDALVRARDGAAEPAADPQFPPHVSPPGEYVPVLEDDPVPERLDALLTYESCVAERVVQATSEFLARGADAAHAAAATDAPMDRALVALRAGNAPLAIQELGLVLANDPKDARALARRAAAWTVFRGALAWTARLDRRALERAGQPLHPLGTFASGLVLQDVHRDPIEAARCFEACVTNSSGDLESWARLGFALVDGRRAEDRPRAIAAFEAATACLPRGEHELALFRRALLELGALHSSTPVAGASANERLARLVTAYTQLLAAAPNDLDARIARGAAQLGLSDADAALADLEAVVAAAPERADAWTWIGSARLAKHEDSLAIEAWGRALTLDPARRDARRLRAQLFARLARFEFALSDYDALVEQDPNDSAALRARAAVRATRDEIDAALADLDRVLAANPSASAHVARGRVRLRRRDWDDARADFEAALAFGMNADAERGLDDVLVLRDGVSLEEAHYRRVFASEATTAAGHLERARLLRGRGELERALEECSAAADLAPKDPTPELERGRVLLALKRPLDAHAAFTRCIELDPECDDARLEGVALLAAAGQPRDVIHEATIVLARQSGNPWAREHRARAELELGRYDDAIDDFGFVYRNARDKDAARSGLASAYHGRGALRHAAGSLAGAEADFSSAIALDPRSARSYYARALVRRDRYDTARAKEDEAKARELDSRLSAIEYETSRPELNVVYAERCSNCSGTGQCREPDRTESRPYSTTLTTVDRWGSTSSRILSSGSQAVTIRGSLAECPMCGGSGTVWR